ncbi:vacuolar protein sorting-associated protein 41 [Auriculariales sp. MPI-PUGE-AT-0066]|nr:vacuolar protein sorting-associated protein 41 [Auriculariales sp. MPI-PUGE-AT-0066]
MDAGDVPESHERALSASPEPVHTDEELHIHDNQHDDGSYDGSSSGEDESGSDSDDDDDDEPALKYERLGGQAATLFSKDSASTLAFHHDRLVVGTHMGMVHILDLTGKVIKSYRPHSASVLDICVDSTGDFVATASVDGRVVVYSLSTPEVFSFDFKRPMRTVALEPNFGKRSTRAYVSGGMAGTLVMHEKGWLGHQQTTIGSDEGPIWLARWRGQLIAWANDLGVKIYDTASQSRIAFIDRDKNSPRADLFKCSFYWQDDTTVLVGWADHLKIVRIRSRVKPGASAATLSADVSAVLLLDCMVSGIVPHISPIAAADSGASTPSSFLVLAYVPPEDVVADEATEDRTAQRRKESNPPQLRLISRAGKEHSNDLLSVPNYSKYSCNDYSLIDADTPGGRCYVVMSPTSIVIARPRDQRDHVEWLVERKRYEEALEEAQKFDTDGQHTTRIGEQYVEHLISEGQYEKAAAMCPKVYMGNGSKWENLIYLFTEKHQLPTIIPYVPTNNPRLSQEIYGLILAHIASSDRPALLQTIKLWPPQIYDIPAVIELVLSRLKTTPRGPDTSILMECLAELYMFNRQPGKALEYYLRLRRPNVFDLIREHNLFTSVQDQALLLVEFDQELIAKRTAAQAADEPNAAPTRGRPPANTSKATPIKQLLAQTDDRDHGAAIKLLVDHTHSIPVQRVVQQLQARPQYLFMYLDSLYERDAYLAADYSDRQVQLYAEYAPKRLIDFLRTSNYYSLEKAYKICKDKDFVPEMVFLLGKMGDNKKALTLIIERLGDVNRAIDFAKEQNDKDLWEDLLKYSETRPAFIRGLLENVGGAEINPIMLIRRIKNGLEIPGLKPALIKILQDYNLQISLLEGCQEILRGDCTNLARRLQRSQTSGFFLTPASICQLCNNTLHRGTDTLTIMFLCRHVVHATCVHGIDALVRPQDATIALNMGVSLERSLAAKVSFMVTLRSKMDQGCPVCYKLHEGE